MLDRKFILRTCAHVYFDLLDFGSLHARVNCDVITATKRNAVSKSLAQVTEGVCHVCLRA